MLCDLYQEGEFFARKVAWHVLGASLLPVALDSFGEDFRQWVYNHRNWDVLVALEQDAEVSQHEFFGYSVFLPLVHDCEHTLSHQFQKLGRFS